MKTTISRKLTFEDAKNVEAVWELSRKEDSRETWNSMSGYQDLLHQMLKYGDFMGFFPYPVCEANERELAAMRALPAPMFDRDIRVAEVGGTMAEIFFHAFGVSAKSVDAGFIGERMLTRDESRLTSLSSWKRLFGTQSYDYTCSRMLFDSPNIKAIAEDAENVYAQGKAAQEELFLVFANLTAMGGLSFHESLPGDWYTKFGRSFFEQRGFRVKTIPSKFENNDVWVFERVIPRPAPVEPLVVGRKSVRYVAETNRWELV